jgi:hypothetical protein
MEGKLIYKVGLCKVLKQVPMWVNTLAEQTESSRRTVVYGYSMNIPK